MLGTRRLDHRASFRRFRRRTNCSRRTCAQECSKYRWRAAFENSIKQVGIVGPTRHGGNENFAARRSIHGTSPRTEDFPPGGYEADLRDFQETSAYRWQCPPLKPREEVLPLRRLRRSDRRSPRVRDHRHFPAEIRVIGFKLDQLEHLLARNQLRETTVIRVSVISDLPLEVSAS
jgi:hypothetical protein